MKLIVDGKSYEVELQGDTVIVNGTSFKTTVLRDNGDATVRVAGRPYKVKMKDEKTVVVDGRSFSVETSGKAAVRRPVAKVAGGQAKVGGNGGGNGASNGAVRAPMPGTVLSLRAKEGEVVAAGAVLLILEAMKMQNEIKAPHGGTVKRIPVTPGQTVNNGDVLAVVE